jgi:hypothetical protein
MVRKISSRAILAGTGVMAVILLAACGGQNNAGGSTTSSVASSNPAGMSTPSMATDTGTPSTATAPAGTAGGGSGSGGSGGGTSHGGECRSTDLKLSIGKAGAAMSHDYVPLQFTNISRASCVVQGFPGVSYVTGDNGQQVGAPAVRDGSIGPAVTLAPGQMAYALITEVQVGVFDPNACKPTPVRGLRVYPPDETASLFVAQSTTGCAGTSPEPQLHVQTIKAGAGNQS